MSSTGEVACLGDNYLEAFFSSWTASDLHITGKRLLLSIDDDAKTKLLEPIRALDSAGWDLFATEGTHDFLSRRGIGCTFLYKGSERREPNAITAITSKEVDLIVNIPSQRYSTTATDGFGIRRLAIDNHIPLITNLQIAQLLLTCLTHLNPEELPIRSWNEYIGGDEKSFQATNEYVYV